MNEPQIKINVSKLFNTLENIKIYHWVTTDYQTHVFLDDFHENISKIIDELVQAALSPQNSVLQIQSIRKNDIALQSLQDLFNYVYINIVQFYRDTFNQNAQYKFSAQPIIDDFQKIMVKYSYLIKKLP